MIKGRTSIIDLVSHFFYDLVGLLFLFFSSLTFFSGVHSEGETHVPIPNTIVKNLHDDGTAHLSVGE